jgi:hypothetical protein
MTRAGPAPEDTRPAWPQRDRQDAAGVGVLTSTPLPVQFGVLTQWAERGHPQGHHREMRGQDPSGLDS